MEYHDIEITCTDKDCTGKKFVWTSGEQSFLNELKEDGKIKEVMQPTRCEGCREKKKARFAKKEQENY